MTQLIYASPQEAKQMIRKGNVPNGLFVQGDVDLSHELYITKIPEGFRGCHHLILDGCTNLIELPDGLEVMTLSVKSCTGLEKLPSHLRCSEVLAMGSGIREVPATIKIDRLLDLSHCYELQTLPDGLFGTPKVILSGCRNLRRLPVNWHVKFLNITGCLALKRLPDGLVCEELHGANSGLQCIDNHVTVNKTLSLYNSTELTNIDGIKKCNRIDLSDCVKLERLPEGLRVDYVLQVSNCPTLEELPSGLQANELIASYSGLRAIPADARIKRVLNLENCDNLTHLPDDMRIHEVILNNCSSLKRLPVLRSHTVLAQGSGIEEVAGDSRISSQLDLTNCTQLKSIGVNLVVYSLTLSGCTTLERLPDDLHVGELIMMNCVNFTTWGQGGSFVNTVTQSQINLAGCTRLTYIPDWFKEIGRLNVSNCPNLKELPENLYVQVIELANSGLTSLPKTWTKTKIRWRGVEVNARTAFKPETLTYRDVLNTNNLEVRRIMIERMGYERFFEQAQAEELDKDSDAGGERRLLRVQMDEPENSWWQPEAIVCLAVNCPSTERKYILRVPATMESCHQAAAWVAGFDDPQLYQPIKET